jgi:acetyltransferase-like isoleucine patch superfamily enzyme
MQIVQEVGFNRVFRYAIFTAWQFIFDLLPFSPLRILWLKFGGAKIGSNTVIDKIDFINLDRTGLVGLNIGSRCFLGRGTMLDLAGKISLEDWVTVSPRVIILSHLNVGFKNHPLVKLYPSQIGHTQVKSGCFIGANTTLLGGVVIGETSLIGAGSVVTQNIPSQSLAVGCPALVKKKLTS